MGILVSNEALIETPIPKGVCHCEDIHGQLRALTIDVLEELPIVSSSVMLHEHVDGIVGETALSVVVKLEVARRRSEAEKVVKVMEHVGGIEDLGDSGGDEGLHIARVWLIGVPEGEVTRLGIDILRAAKTSCRNDIVA